MNSITLLALLLAIAGGGYWFHEKKQRTDAHDLIVGEIRSLETNIEQKKSVRASLLKQLEPARAAKAATTTAAAGTVAVINDNEKLRSDVTALSSDWESTTAAFEASLESVRAEARKKTIPEIKLTGGTVLKNCQIRGFGDGFIRIEHADGVERVRNDELTPEWVSRFSLDYVSSKAGAVSEIVESKAELDRARQRRLAAVGGTATEGAKLEELEDQLSKLSAQITSLERQSKEFIRQMYRPQGGAGSQAAFRSSMNSQSKAADGKKAALQKQYVVLRKQKLDFELEIKDNKKKAAAAEK